jgi:hypothetical protein
VKIADFTAAVAAFEPVELPIELPQLGTPELLVVGEPHGAEQTAHVVLTLMRRLGLRGLALEWPEDELAAIDLDPARLGELPAGAEAMSGDGRVTAGLFALVHELDPEPLILLDLHGDHGEDRSTWLQERLLEQLDAEVPTLALVGGIHAYRMYEDGLDAVLLDYDGGSIYHYGVTQLDPPPPELDLPRIALEPARPAAVPTA